MKILFESHPTYQDDVKIGIHWYKHKRKEWKGFTTTLVFLLRSLSITVVDNYAAYDCVINKRKKWNPNAT